MPAAQVGRRRFPPAPEQDPALAAPPPDPCPGERPPHRCPAQRPHRGPRCSGRPQPAGVGSCPSASPYPGSGRAVAPSVGSEAWRRFCQSSGHQFLRQPRGGRDNSLASFLIQGHPGVPRAQPAAEPPGGRSAPR